jgi:hypothetical protein
MEARDERRLLKLQAQLAAALVHSSNGRFDVTMVEPRS